MRVLQRNAESRVRVLQNNAESRGHDAALPRIRIPAVEWRYPNRAANTAGPARRHWPSSLVVGRARGS
jgi:hypothetical protein